MKAVIIRDSYEPFYYIDEGDVPKSIDIPDELKAEHDRLLVEIDAFQARLAQLYWSTR
jgi:hypothetical protein